MSDRRLTPANARVAAAHLKGKVQAERFVEGIWRQVITPYADILASPHGARDRQALFGEHVLVLEEHEGHAFGQSAKDGYVGYIRADQLGAALEPTHWLSAPASHLYSAADLKSPEIMPLSFGSYLSITAEQGDFFETRQGHFVPKIHLHPVGEYFSDPVAVAALFLGSPYLWGGNTRSGLDCSALVQAAHLACGLECPPDSDMQQDQLGTLIGDNVKPRRGDLFFWKGHVAMVKDEQTLIHANGHHMSTVEEPMNEVIRRIENQGYGPVLARKRL